MSKNKILLLITGLTIIFAGFWIVNRGSANSPVQTEDGSKVQVTVYKSPTCGCCGNYISYLKRSGFEVETVTTQDMDSVKNEHNIPSDMQSCHTTVVGDYVVEGHVPVEAITKLLDEKPELDGIALPGMPGGSPGMPGAKNDVFAVYGISSGDSQSVFVEL